jgi:hypothetical protein
MVSRDIPGMDSLRRESSSRPVPLAGGCRKKRASSAAVRDSEDGSREISAVLSSTDMTIEGEVVAKRECPNGLQSAVREWPFYIIPRRMIALACMLGFRPCNIKCRKEVRPAGSGSGSR